MERHVRREHAVAVAVIAKNLVDLAFRTKYDVSGL